MQDTVIPVSERTHPRQEQVQGRELWLQVAPFAVVFLLACFVFFWQLGKLPLFNPDEGLFAEPAREILETGEWTTSLLNYVVRYTKPPLVMWAMALSYQVFGVNEFAARFFGAACGAVLVAATYCCLNRNSGRRAAAVGSVTLLTAPLFVGTARMAITDLPLSLFFAGSLMCFYRAFAEKAPFWRWAGYVLVGLAVMTKGPVAIVLPAVILAAYHLLRGNLLEAIQFYKPHFGVLIVALMAGPWFAIEIAVTKGEYFRAFILRENFQRFTAVVDSHKGGWWYHLAAMMGGYFPWSIFVPQAIYGVVSSAIRRARSSNMESSPAATAQSGAWAGVSAALNRVRTAFQNLSPEQDLCLFATCWALITLVFFSLSVSKLMTYTLPAFPALAILVALEVMRIVQSRAIARLLPALAILAIIYGAAGLIAPTLLHKLRDCPPDLFAIVRMYISAQCVITIAAVVLAVLRRPGIAIAAFAVLTLGATAYAGQKAAVIVSRHWEGALPDFARYVAVSQDPIVLFDLRKPATPFYTRRQVIHPAGREALLARLSGFDKAYVLTKSKNSSFFEAVPGCRVVARQGYVMLVGWKRPVNVEPMPSASVGNNLSLAN